MVLIHLVYADSFNFWLEIFLILFPLLVQENHVWARIGPQPHTDLGVRGIQERVNAVLMQSCNILDSGMQVGQRRLRFYLIIIFKWIEGVELVSIFLCEILCKGCKTPFNQSINQFAISFFIDFILCSVCYSIMS